MSQTTQPRVAVVTDSTADIPAELVARYNIHVVPQILIMGKKTWLDGVDIDSATFYELLQTSPHFPSTSQPSIHDFHTLFTKLSTEWEGIVAVLVSNELSGTVNSALGAKQSLPDIPIEIVDSRAVSMQLGLMVLPVARAAAAGGDLQTVAQVARGMVGRTQVYFVVDTLEYLHRGGRIGAASRLMGTALNLKPLLEVRDGIVQPLARIRSRRKALDRLYALLEEQLASAARVHMAVLHIDVPDEAARLREQLTDRFQPAEMFLCECGPVVGTHAGPGTVAVAFYAE